jgi:hypothetical protein
MDSNNKKIVFEKLTVDEEDDMLTFNEESKIRGGVIIQKPDRPCAE